jgi:hypothetical protein
MPALDAFIPPPSPGAITWIDEPYFSGANSVTLTVADTTAEALSVDILREAVRMLEQADIPSDDYTFVRSTDELRRMHEQLTEPIAARLAKREAVEKKGLKLLMENLLPGQKEQYKKKRHFDVRGSHGGLYRIHHGIAGNVEVLDKKGKRKHGLCFVPVGNLCTGDVLLIQKVALEMDEKATLAKAHTLR